MMTLVLVTMVVGISVIFSVGCMITTVGVRATLNCKLEKIQEMAEELSDIKVESMKMRQSGQVLVEGNDKLRDELLESQTMCDELKSKAGLVDQLQSSMVSVKSHIKTMEATVESAVSHQKLESELKNNAQRKYSDIVGKCDICLEGHLQKLTTSQKAVAKHKKKVENLTANEEEINRKLKLSTTRVEILTEREAELKGELETLKSDIAIVRDALETSNAKQHAA